MASLLSAGRFVLGRVAQGGVVTDIQRAAAGSGLYRLFSTAADDSHDDFKPKVKGQAGASVAEQIEADVKSHNVFLYMKGVPQAPMCGFSNMACRILEAYEVEFGSRDVLSDPELREGVKAYTAWPTIPQIFIGGEFVGGSDILMQMHQSGELGAKLKEGDK